jgi:queuine tRNA-ribosyltransferase accessory subunit
VDIEFGRPAPGLKRKDKMAERSTAWVRSLVTSLKTMKSSGQKAPQLWVPILPFDAEMQTSYLEDLEEIGTESINGIVVYDMGSILCIPDSLKKLPIICLAEPRSPHHILDSVSAGVDVATIPFINSASEAGIAFQFTFPPLDNSKEIIPLGIDLWPESFATDTSPLQTECTCYACTQHHRAYIRHLLSAKEMLAWVLLQIHNHHVMDNFYRGIRESIANNSFGELARKFRTVYDAEFPKFQGQGPRYDDPAQ